MLALFVSVFSLSSCKKSSLDLGNYLIEERNNLFTGGDSLYTVTISSGLRETEYKLDGNLTEMTDFAVLTFSKNNNEPLANDNYTYIVKIDDESLTGFLVKNPVDNSYVVDLERSVNDDAKVHVEIGFSGYNFKADLTNTSNDFNVDKNSALKIATSELKSDVNNVLSDKNVKIEVVMKILKDYSNVEVKNYYWYVGVISTNGDTLGILINANNGDVVAKKV